MNVQVTATLIAAGTDLISELIRNRKLSTPTTTTSDAQALLALLESQDKPQKRATERVEESKPSVINITPQQLSIEKPVKSKQLVEIESPVSENKATAVATGCLPCSLQHLGTCTGLLNESTRFATGEMGPQDSEVVDRVNMCLDELNSLEREDLRPEKVSQLTGWERDLAEKVLIASRSTRHQLEDVKNVNVRGLTDIAGNVSKMRKEIGREWFNNKIASLSPVDQDNIKNRVMQRINEMREQAARGEIVDEGEETAAEE